jgi:hypothetical protein
MRREGRLRRERRQHDTRSRTGLVELVDASALALAQRG